MAFETRVHSVDSVEYSNFIETDRLISSGTATVIIPPTKGTLKLSNCIDDVFTNDIISFDNDLLIFCYEGGPNMLIDEDDTILLEIVSTDGSESEVLTIVMEGFTPFRQLYDEDRAVRMLEGTQATLSVDSDFIFFRDNVTAPPDAFQLRIDTIPPKDDITLTDSIGNEIVDGTILNFNETIIFTPFPDFVNCAWGGFRELTYCNLFSAYSKRGDEFTFSILAGDNVLIGPLPYYYLVSIRTATLDIPNSTIAVPTKNSIDDTVYLTFTTEFISIIPNEDYIGSVLSLEFKVISGDVRFIFVNWFSLSFWSFSLSISGCNEFRERCVISIEGEPEDIIAFLDRDNLLFNFNVSDIENCLVDISTNQGQQLNRITFLPETHPEAYYSPDIDDYSEETEGHEDNQTHTDPPTYYSPDIDDYSEETEGHEDNQTDTDPPIYYSPDIDDYSEETEGHEDNQTDTDPPIYYFPGNSIPNTTSGLSTGFGVFLGCALLGIIIFFLFKVKRRDGNDISGESKK